MKTKPFLKKSHPLPQGVHVAQAASHPVVEDDLELLTSCFLGLGLHSSGAGLEHRTSDELGKTAPNCAKSPASNAVGFCFTY